MVCIFHSRDERRTGQCSAVMFAFSINCSFPTYLGLQAYNNTEDFVRLDLSFQSTQSIDNLMNIIALGFISSLFVFNNFVPLEEENALVFNFEGTSWQSFD